LPVGVLFLLETLSVLDAIPPEVTVTLDGFKLVLGPGLDGVTVDVKLIVPA
jgi:hypothetical protein